MNILDSTIIIILIAVLNVIVYGIFKKYFFGRPDAGMKFLTVNIVKDLIWLVIVLSVINKTKANFLLIIICFITSSVLIYMSVIRKINKS